jgi:hypothetical protein
MKVNTILLSSSLLLLSACATQSLDTGASTDKVTNTASSALTDVVNSAKENLIADYAAKQLGLPKDKASSALGAVFKAAQGNLSSNDFASLGKAIPGVDSLIEKAPEVSGLASSLTGGKASLGYLDAAFKQIGVPKETVLPLVNVLTGYLDQNNMGSASAMLKQGLNFL